MSYNDFYITAPSKTKSATSTQNTPSEFSIRLPKQFDLHGDWQVALTDITYPYSWNNVGYYSEQDGYIHIRMFRKSHFVTVKVPHANYGSVDQLVEAINNAIEEKGWLIYKESPNPLSAFNFLYDDVQRRVVISMNYNLLPEGADPTIYLSELLQYILGFTNQKYGGLFGRDVIAPYLPDISGGCSALFVYLDICEPQIVGDSCVPLLRTVPIRTADVQFGQQITESFPVYHYVPINAKILDTFKITINTVSGKRMAFNYGSVIAKLHFMKRERNL